MSNLALDLFAEDRGHEAFLRAVVERVASEESCRVSVQVRSGKGGHGKALSEFRLYQKLVEKGQMPSPDLLVIAIDGNCKGFAEARREIQERIEDTLKGKAVIACPDPHVERWYMADPVSFAQVIGNEPKLEKTKCERDRYKKLLKEALGGGAQLLDGIEYAQEIVSAMDWFRAGKNDASLGTFLNDLKAALRTFSSFG
jgi:hypothetical protein